MSKVKILVVDDSISLRTISKKILSGQDDFNVIGEAADGAQALELLKTVEPDVIILDLVMPIMDGKETLSKIMERGHKAKVVIASSVGGEDSVEECLKLGATSYVQKPYEHEDLVRVVRLANAS
ncbi:response regulator transcription factor [Marinomonas mediterranea]|uniref:Response regulator receiver protein n=1 Tax=Marinomonas mediterranea (strain ATCC 700492 / JCM 21426 / NBRC 103028 / MMB-1) TaxID=717774 RepID=F2JYV0_MARM1|nr:response regulator [Marinomonas mediterranea]ADZ89725.1 response regulator receiver protein [Marinomonas mediterranea MMB-1]WCN07820.1 response regulator [Marinomonas mediterranea]WCN11914.1 response regulator [Marinomonas mediterranea]WCN15952.1 response regulator [Marinomonas mediterranea MMB-1]